MKPPRAVVCSPNKHPKHCCCFWIPLLPIIFFNFLFFPLSILFAFQTHREVHRSKPAVVSFSADKIRLSKAGPCFWGKEKTALGFFHEQESNRELPWRPSYLAKKDGPASMTTSLWVQECCHMAQPTRVRPFSWFSSL